MSVSRKGVFIAGYSRHESHEHPLYLGVIREGAKIVWRCPHRHWGSKWPFDEDQSAMDCSRAALSRGEHRRKFVTQAEAVAKNSSMLWGAG